MALGVMQMSEYLSEIQHAVSNTFELALSEQRQLQATNAFVARQTAEAEESARKVQWLVDNPDLDDDLLATSMYWESYFGPEKCLYYGKKNREFLSVVLEVQRFSTAALNGSILQYAKQGISLVHSELGHSPGGRSIGTQPLKEVLWQSRNQALHWEDGEFSRAVERCFEGLSTDIDRKFGEFRTRNMASEIIGLLGWRSFTDFEKDMLSLS